MKVIVLSATQLSAAAGSNEGKFTLAVNQIIPGATSTTSSVTNATYTFFESVLAGNGVSTRGTVLAGDNAPEVNVTPSFFPVATKGAECAALVSSLNWADTNLETYEFIQVASSLYFVTGVLNSSQTEANDPFSSLGNGGSACCWAGEYAPGLNPF